MQPEKAYLWEASQLMNRIIESEDLKITFDALTTLHNEVYPRMKDYGFVIKEEVRNSVQSFRSSLADPSKEMRLERLERWEKDGMTKLEKKKLGLTKDNEEVEPERSSLTQTIMSVGRVIFGKDRSYSDKDDAEKEHE